MKSPRILRPWLRPREPLVVELTVRFTTSTVDISTLSRTSRLDNLPFAFRKLYRSVPAIGPRTRSDSSCRSVPSTRRRRLFGCNRWKTAMRALERDRFGLRALSALNPRKGPGCRALPTVRSRTDFGRSRQECFERCRDQHEPLRTSAGDRLT
jgi:hypothetical protein